MYAQVCWPVLPKLRGIVIPMGGLTLLTKCLTAVDSRRRCMTILVEKSVPFDLRMLRSFRCLRPLKMVSKVPSKLVATSEQWRLGQQDSKAISKTLLYVGNSCLEESVLLDKRSTLWTCERAFCS